MDNRALNAISCLSQNMAVYGKILKLNVSFFNTWQTVFSFHCDKARKAGHINILTL
jgi:hypothetical protein